MSDNTQGNIGASVAQIVFEETTMARDLILWLAGVPLIVIIGLHLFGVF